MSDPPPIIGPAPPGGARLVVELPRHLTDRQARKLARVIRRRLDRNGLRGRRASLVTEKPKGGRHDRTP